MYHFVALLWSADDPTARRRRCSWKSDCAGFGSLGKPTQATDGCSGFRFATRRSGPALLCACGGERRCARQAVLGRSLEAVPGSRLSRSMSTRSGRSSGPGDSIWSGISGVATWRMLADRQARCGYAIRDCSGKIPCYHRRFRDVTIVFADINDLAPLELPALTVNWSTWLRSSIRVSRKYGPAHSTRSRRFWLASV